MVHSFEGRKPRVHESSFVAWNAEVLGDVDLEEGSSVWYGAVSRADIGRVRVGRNSNVQDGSVIHVDADRPCLLGEGVTIGHRAVLHSCSIGDHALVGMGAVVLDGAEIGSECIVGAGALVTQGKKFPPRSMILGSPAKVARELTEEEAKGLHHHAEEYAKLARRVKEGCEEER
ncbi:MAG: gamma carbonic anhydrase family protein [Spirochaetaceae bacterium]|nr:gamma carbonic anhydrase family protein [Spirochaetaceae bacterium]